MIIIISGSLNQIMGYMSSIFIDTTDISKIVIYKMINNMTRTQCVSVYVMFMNTLICYKYSIQMIHHNQHKLITLAAINRIVLNNPEKIINIKDYTKSARLTRKIALSKMAAQLTCLVQSLLRFRSRLQKQSHVFLSIFSPPVVIGALIG